MYNILRWNLPWSFVCVCMCLCLFFHPKINLKVRIHWLGMFEIQAQKSFAVALVFVCVCTPRQKHNVSVFSLLLISGILEAWFRFFLHKNATFIQIHSCTDSLLLLRLSSTYHTAHTHIYLWEIEKTNISLLSACFSSKQFLKHDSSALQTY